jgi:transcriptional regulator with XRE-family HTH domain
MGRERLVARRLELGLTQEGLAYRLDVDPRTVRRWESGASSPQPLQRRPLADALEVTLGELAALLTDRNVGSRSLDRRAVLTGSLATVALASLGPPPRAVGSEAIRYLRSQLDGYWRTDRDLGPHVVLPGAVGQCVALLHMVDVTRGQHHTEVLHLAAAYTGFVAWLYQDAGDLAACAGWLDRTLELAHRARDPQLLAYALTSKAMLSADLEDGMGAVELAQGALVTAGAVGAKARAMAMQQAAVGYALVGDRAAVDRLLDDVGELLEDVHRDARVWGGDRLHSDPDHVVGVYRATCYGYLGMGREAAELWGALGAATTSARRDRGVYLARHAAALLAAGEPEEAAERAALGVPLVGRTGSARMRREFDRVRDQASPWVGTDAGRSLAAALAPLAT